MTRTLTARGTTTGAVTPALRPSGRARRARNTLGLTDREQHIVVLAADGRSDVEIADQLGIGRGSVLTYWRRIRLKLEANNRTAAVVQYVLAMQERMLTPLIRLHAQAGAALRAGSGTPEMARLQAAIRERFKGEALAIVSSTGHLVYLSPSAGEKVGRTPEDVVGRHCREFVPPGSETRLMEILGKRELGHGSMESLFVVGGNGETRRIISMAAPVFDDRDTYCGTFVVFDAVL